MTTLLRRTAAVAAYTVVLIFLLAMSPAVMLAGAIHDIFFRTHWGAVRTYLFIVTFLCYELLGVGIATALWVARLLGRYRSDTAWEAVNFRLQCWWAQGLTRAGLAFFRVRVDFRCDYPFGNGPFLLLMRHASVLDTMVAACYIAVPNEVHLRYVLKKELLWDPCLDIVGNRLPNCFIDRDGQDSTVALTSIGALARGMGEREGVLIYPEGTRFSTEKRKRILARLAASDSSGRLHMAESLTHTLPPRTGGVLALMKARPDCDVLICAHEGLEQAARFIDLIRGRIVGKTVRIQVWYVEAQSVSATDAGRIEWLHGEWQRVNRYVSGASAADGELRDGSGCSHVSL